jgi:hypothetical protein
VPTPLVVAYPDIWLGPALHTQLDGSRRSLCIVARLAQAIKDGDALCDNARIAWVPPQPQLAAYSDSQWGGRTGSEGRTHRDLRAVAALYLAAAVPSCRLHLPPSYTPAGHRRADLLATDGMGQLIATELGAIDADSIFLQLTSLGMGHVLVLPYAGVQRSSVRCYVFRLSSKRPLPSPTRLELRETWPQLLAAALTAATYRSAT